MSPGEQRNNPRGAISILPNRFERLRLEPDEDWNPEESPLPRTHFYKDLSSTLITYNNSPDVGFEASINVYRGCEHGCVYCYARPFHEYLGFSAGLDFESKIMVKENAARLLREELSSKKWQPKVVAMSGVTDCYQPIERKLKLTRACLEVFAEFRNPVAIVTKNNLVTRDIDILSKLAECNAVAVFISLTTLDSDLRKVMEPRTSPPAARLDAVRALADAGIPVGILMAPVVPGLTDPEIPKLVQAAADAGAKYAGYVTLRLPYAVSPLFEKWLSDHFPEKKERVLNRVRAMRGGKLYDAEFGTRMTGEGIFAQQIEKMFEVARRKAGIVDGSPNLSTEAFRRPGGKQLELLPG